MYQIPEARGIKVFLVNAHYVKNIPRIKSGVSDCQWILYLHSVGLLPPFSHRFWRILVSSTKVFERIRAKFLGKCSPVHFFWRSFDLVSTRFSGQHAPQRKGVISGPAYSHELCSAGSRPPRASSQARRYLRYFDIIPV
jgi:hypothetical protein